MTYKIRKQLKRLSNKQFAEDIKIYLKSSHEFYGIKVPELRVLAKRLHEEYELRDFYKVFNRLWRSSYHEEVSLAIYTLQLYRKEFDLGTWRFLKPKLKDLRSWDQVDSVSTSIIGEILLRYPQLSKEILKLAKSKNMWMRRIAIVSTLPLIKKGEIELTMKLVNMYVNDTGPYIQKATGWMLREVGNKKPEIAKRFILKHVHMPSITFSYATEHMTELRKMRKLKKLEGDKKGWFFRRG